MVDNGISKNMEIKIQASIEGAEKVTKSIKEIYKEGKTIVTLTKTGLLNKETGEFKSLGNNISLATNHMKRFKMEYLSILFFSQYASKIFSNIIKQSFSAFTEISQGANKGSKTLAILGANFKYLQFVIADTLINAIEPFIPVIISLIDMMADFIEQHPEEIFIGLGTAIAGFSLAGLLAQFALLVNSFAIMGESAGEKFATNFKKSVGILSLGLGLALSYDALTKGGFDLENVLSAGLTAYGLKSFGIFKGTSTIKLFGWVLALQLVLEFILNQEETTRSIGKLVGTVMSVIISATELLVALDPFKAMINTLLTGKFDFSGLEDFFQGFDEALVGGFLETLDDVNGKWNKIAKEELSSKWYLPTETESLASTDNNQDISEKLKSSWMEYSNLIKTDTPQLTSNIGQISSSLVGSEGTKEGSVFSSILTTEKAFDTLKTNSITDLKEILASVDALNKTVVTTHIIKTIHQDDGGGSSSSIGSNAFGTGFVPSTGLYTLHQGEMVIPSGTGVNVGGVNLTVNANTTASASDIADIVENRILDNIQRYI